MGLVSDNPFPKIILVEGSTPSSPSAGQQKVFIASSDNKAKRVNSGATVKSIDGDVDGPASAVASRIAIFSGTTGKLLADGGQTIASLISAVAAVKLDEASPSAVGTFTFSSLGSFTHLEIRWLARSSLAATNSESMRMRMNADTGGNYDNELIFNNAPTTAAAFEELGGTSCNIGLIPAATATAGRAGGGVIAIPDYRGTTFVKVANSQSHSSFADAGPLSVRYLGSTWRNAAAITSITIFLGSGNFVAGSKFSLYGWN